MERADMFSHWVRQMEEEMIYRPFRKWAAEYALSRARPRNISEADWRIALRRKLNGDTR